MSVKKRPEDTVVYKGTNDFEKQENIKRYTLASNFLKRSALELTHNEQYALVEGLSIFAIRKKPKEHAGFNLPEFKGDTENEKLENAVFGTLLQNIIQKFEQRLTEEEKESIYLMMMERVVEKDTKE